MANCTDCQNEQRIKTLEEDARRNQDTHKEFFSRFEAVATARATSDTNLQNILRVVEEVRADVKALKEKPSKRYESILSAVVQWAILLALGFIAVQLGLK